MPQNNDGQDDAPMVMSSLMKILAYARSGIALQEIDQLIGEVSKAVCETKKVGKVTLEISVKPLGKRHGTAVQVEVALKGKTPEHDVEPDVFFVADDGQVMREDPRQVAMFPSRAERGDNEG